MFYKVGCNQLLDWVLDGRILDNRVSSERYYCSSYAIAHVAVAFGRVCYLSIIDGCATYDKACELAQSYQDASLYLARERAHFMADEYEVWELVDDDALWGEWDRKIVASRRKSGLPICSVCGDDCGPWVRVPTPGGFGAWAYLCESCFDRYNSINTLVGRHRLECY